MPGAGGEQPDQKSSPLLTEQDKVPWQAHSCGQYTVILSWPACVLWVLGATLEGCGWGHNSTVMMFVSWHRPEEPWNL